MKPLIYLFRNPTGYYIYDINTNQVLDVDKDFYHELNEYIDGLNNDVTRNKKYVDLSKNGYLSCNHPDIIASPINEYVNIYLNNYLNNIVFQVTRNCNMKCRYCYFSGSGDLSRTHSKERMSWDTAKKALDFFTNKSELSSKIQIGFYGGEPMLEFPLIQKIVDYANNKYFEKEITYAITTNGTIMNEEIISFFVKNDIKLTVSIDGPKLINDTYRRYAHNGQGTFDTVYQNLLLIQRTNPEYYKTIIINAVVERDTNFITVENYFKTDELFKDTIVFFNKVADRYSINQYGSTIDFICGEKTKELNDILSFNNKHNRIFERGVSNLNQIKNSFLRLPKLDKTFHHSGTCIPGYKKLFVTVNGDFYPCEKANEKSKNVKIGSVNCGFDYSVINNMMNTGKLTEDRCKKCICMRHCRICAINIDNFNEFSLKIKNGYCDYNISEFKELLNDYTVYKKIGLIK